MKTRIPNPVTRPTTSHVLADAALIPTSQFAGTVVDSGPAGRWAVRSGSRVLMARRAASCLLEPAPGDSVACLALAPDEVWVLAVLQREEGVMHVLCAQGPARLQSAAGALTLQAADLRLEGERITVQAQALTADADQAQLSGRQLSVIGNGIKVCGALLSTVFERVTHFSRSHLRTTSGLDRVSAQQIDQQAEQLMQISGEHVLVQGERLVKARGAQIHFG
ncbi:MAG: DUF3540 domain-containing protein [Comamonadaceae bacterium]|nr:MAG: DUF3540 domain-containing protein [Comamonadaceae bacterium]